MANKKRKDVNGTHWRKVLGEDMTDKLHKVSLEEERSMTSQVRYFVKQGLRKTWCTGCGEVNPVCYCEEKE